MQPISSTKSPQLVEMNQVESGSGSSSYVNHQSKYVNQRPNYRDQSAVGHNTYAALQGIGSSRNEYQQLNK